MTQLEGCIRFWEAELLSVGPILGPDLRVIISETVKYLKALKVLVEAGEVTV